MGIAQDFLAPLSQRFLQLGTASQVGVVIASVIGLSVFFNVLNQLLFKNPNEPPMVFHWFPIIGSTITYGMDPPSFFWANRAKVTMAASTTGASIQLTYGL